MADMVASQSPSPSTDTSSQTNEELFASDEFRMFAYKILPCPKKTQHEWSTCPYSHPNEKARRRDPRIYSYLAIPCEATKQGGTCPRGDDCPNCHSLFEYWLHPSRYRTQLCRDLENGICKRQVCFFAHSIEELRVPDHSHLNIPPEMQAAAANSNNSSNSSQSSDTPAATSNSSSGSSTPRANSKDGSNSNKSAASKLPSAASKLPYAGTGHTGSISRANSGRTSRASSNNSPVGQWAGYAGVPAGTAAAAMGNTNGIDRYYAALEQQRALVQLQLQAQGLAPSGGTFYEQQVQHMLKAAELAQAQQQQQQAATQLLMYQSQQAAAAWTAQLARSSMGSMYGDSGNRRSSPPLSPMPAGLGPEGCSPPYGCSPSFGSENRNIFVPPSANSLNSSGGSGSMPGWESASLLRTLSTPANDCNSLASSLSTVGLMRHASSFAAVGAAPESHTSPHFASSGRAGVQMQHNSGSSSLADGQQEMTLASLLAGNCGGDPTWGPAGAGAPAASAGMMPASMGPTGVYGGAGLGQQLGTQGMGQQMGLGSSMGGNSGMDMANLMLLQQQLQQKSALAGALDYLQQSGNNAGGQLGDCNNQAMGDMLGLMVQQLMLQQQSAVV